MVSFYKRFIIIFFIFLNGYSSCYTVEHKGYLWFEGSASNNNHFLPDGTFDYSLTSAEISFIYDYFKISNGTYFTGKGQISTTEANNAASVDYYYNYNNACGDSLSFLDSLKKDHPNDTTLNPISNYDTSCSSVSLSTGFNTETNYYKNIETVTDADGTVHNYELSSGVGTCEDGGLTSDCEQINSNGYSWINFDLMLLGASESMPLWVDGVCYDENTLEKKEHTKKDLPIDPDTWSDPITGDTLNSSNFDNYYNDNIDKLKNDFPEYDPRNPLNPVNPNNPDNLEKNNNDNFNYGTDSTLTDSSSSSKHLNSMGRQLSGIGDAITSGNNSIVASQNNTNKKLDAINQTLNNKEIADIPDYSGSLDSLKNRGGVTSSDSTDLSNSMNNVGNAFTDEANKLIFQLPLYEGGCSESWFDFGNLGNLHISIPFCSFNLASITKPIFKLFAIASIIAMGWKAVYFLLKTFNDLFGG